MAAGDILIHAPLRAAAVRPDGGYDFTPFFEYVSPLFKQAGLVMGNLENPLAGAKSGYTGYPSFNAPGELAANLKSAGFTTLTLANNHALDRNWSGLLHTIATVGNAGLAYMGAYAGPEDKARRLVRDIGGVRVGLLAYTYGVNGPARPPAGEEWRLGFIDRAAIAADMEQARRQGAEWIVVTLHFGEEYRRAPSAEQRGLARDLFAAGADLVIGHHPHVVQPFARGTGPDANKAVIYSLGNFCSNQHFPYTDIGVILDCTLTVNPDGSKALDDVRLIPTLCHRRTDAGGRRTYRVLPLAEAVKNPAAYGLSAAEAAGMRGKLDEMTAHLAGPDSRPAVKLAPKRKVPEKGAVKNASAKKAAPDGKKSGANGGTGRGVKKNAGSNPAAAATAAPKPSGTKAASPAPQAMPAGADLPRAHSLRPPG